MHTHLGPDPFIVGDEPTVISQGQPRLFPHVRPGTHPIELGRLLEGERLGHFDLEEFIGGGGMGAVFRALDTMLNRIVAVKVLSSDQSSDEDTQRRFRNEAQSAARLDHENIARVYYVGEDRGVHYIVFEYIEGINIRELVSRDGPLPLSDAISFTWQIAKAQTHASLRDVVHRDIKPSNVLITPSGRAKLVDMGLARLHQVEHTENDLTASGVTLGTFDYISPEQARDPRMADVRSDLYSLGCTLYFMLTGRPPFPDGTVLQKLLRHQGDAPPDPREFRTDAPEQLALVTMQLLAKSPDARYQTPDDLIAALGEVCDELGLPVSELLRPVPLLVEPQRSTSFSPYRRQLARHLPWVLPLMLLIAATVAIDRFWSDASEGVTFESRLPRTDAQQPDEARRESQSKASSVVPKKASSQQIRSTNTEFATSENAAHVTNSDVIGRAASNPAEEPTAAEAGMGDAIAENFAAEPGAAGNANVALADASSAAATIEPMRTRQTGDSSPSQVATEADVKDPTAETSTTDEATSPLAATESAAALGPLVVDPAGAVGTYATFEAACAAAQSGDVIELRFDGVLTARPVKFNNVTLTIRAARDKQPRILFRPTSADRSPALYARSMLTATGGELTIVGVQLELELPREIASENWALLETRGVQSLGIEQCVLTVRNATEGGKAYHPSVQMIDVKPAPGEGMMQDTPMTTGGGPTKHRPLELRMLNCIARGEAVLLRTQQMESIDFTWQNGLAAISETLVEMNASQSAMHETCHVQVGLQHVTVVARRGLLLTTNSDDAPYPMEAELVCRDSIFTIGADAALVEQRCVQSVSTLQETISWTGERNFFEGFSTFWKIRVLGLGEQDQFPPLAFEAWRTYWQQRPEGYAIQSQLGAVIWKHLPPSSLPLDAQTPDNYLLGMGVAGNPARGAAKNGQDVGFQAELLPVAYDPNANDLQP
jgi:serine/threonine-protein kinase